MDLDIGDKITSISIQGNNVTGNVTAILENTVIILSELNNHVIAKKELKEQGYKFLKVAKRTNVIRCTSNK